MFGIKHERDNTVNTNVIHICDDICAMDTLASRLLYAREKRGLTQDELADKSGVSQGTIGNVESGLRLKPRNLFEIAKALEVDYEWLLTGNGQSEPTTIRESSATPYNDNGKVFVARVRGAHLSAGNGEIVYDFEELDDSHSFKAEWMRSEGLIAKKCKLWEVKGDSMWPTIPGGSLVMINSAEREPKTGNIYALITEDGLRLKRLIRRADGIWEIHSDNPMKAEYPTEAFLPGTVAVLGRVRWSAITH